MYLYEEDSKKKSDFMVKRQRGSAAYPQFKGIGAFPPTSKNAPGIYRSTACQFVKRVKKGSSLSYPIWR